MKTFQWFLCLIGQVFFLSGALFAQAAPDPNIFARLQQYDSLQVEIETDIKQLKSGAAESAWQPAVFKIMQHDSAVFQQKIQVTSRGHMRKKTCDFPPVKIRFYEDRLENDSVQDINELKLVVGCRNSDADEQLVLKECMTYGLYNLVTDMSFRVKLGSVRFTDPNRKRAGIESVAFFIESEKEMAVRLGGRPVKARIISPNGMDTLAYARMCLFEFMIGNTDFGAYTRHNIKVIGFKGAPPVPVPYDFDYSGLVAADYAIPSADLPLQNVQQRYYLGLCRSAESHNLLFKEFSALKPKILDYCQQFPQLSKISRQESLDYLQEFFKIIEDPRKAQKLIVENCGKRVKAKE